MKDRLDRTNVPCLHLGILHPGDLTRFLTLSSQSESQHKNRIYLKNILGTKSLLLYVDVFLKKNLFYLLIFRERRREGEKYWCLRETPIGCLSLDPHWGPGPHNPACALTENRTADLEDRCSNHWATPARAHLSILIKKLLAFFCLYQFCRFLLIAST